MSDEAFFPTRSGTLTGGEWSAAWEIFNRVAGLPVEEWQPAVASQTENPSVRAEVMRMLAELEESCAEEVETPRATVSRAGIVLGKYHIGELLGRGGMGEVYSATDESLGRRVAIKFLSTESNSREQVERFVAEGRAASVFNHPNIVTIYDFVRADDGTLAIVMEMIEGQTLRAALPAGGLPREEFAAYAQQLAGALAAAHARGIVHRDVKPDNVMVRADGVVKLLDFGIARLAASAGEQGSVPPRTAATTAAGTPQYMAPELFGGKAPDFASDMFSLGLVFCEMLTGRLPFGEMTGISALEKTATAAALPSVRGLVRNVPAAIVRLIDKMLAVDPSVRPAAAEAAAEAERWRSAAPWWARPISVGVLTLALLGAAAIYWKATVKEDSLAQLLAVPITTFPGEEIGPSFDPSGENIVFAWSGENEDNFDIYSQPLHANSARRLTTGAAQEFDPVWSHDGRTIAFRRELPGQRTQIVLISPQGTGERVLITTNARAWHYWHCLDWSPDDQWLAFADRNEDARWSIYVVFVKTGEVRRVAAPFRGNYLEPAFSPDGSRIVFIADLDGTHRLMVGPFSANGQAGGQPVELKLAGLEASSARSPRWSPDGRRILFVSNKGSDGSVYQAAIPSSLSEPIRARRLGTLGDQILRLDLASRGGVLGFTRMQQDINIYRLRPAAGGSLDRVLPSTKMERFARVSMDGRYITFQSERSGFPEIWMATADGADPFPLTNFQGSVTGSPVLSPDGRRIAFDTRVDGQPEIYVVDAVRGATPRNLTNHAATDILPAWSPDGRFVYFGSNRSGKYEIWRMPANGGAAGATGVEGSAPSLSPDGKWLYYAVSHVIHRIPVAGGPPERVGEAFEDRAYTPIARGVLFLVKVDARHYTMKQWDAATGRTRVVKEFEGYFASGMSATPDGQTMLLHKMDAHGSDLMAVTGFRP